MNTRTHRSSAWSRVQYACDRTASSLAHALGSSIVRGCRALTLSSPHALVAGVLSGSSVVADGLGPLVDVGSGLATAGIAAHAVRRAIGQYPGCETQFQDVLARSVARANHGGHGAGAAAQVLAMYCDRSSRDTLGSRLARTVAKQIAGHCLAEWLPGIGSVIGVASAGRSAVRGYSFVAAVEAEAHAICQQSERNDTVTATVFRWPARHTTRVRAEKIAA